MTNIPHVSSLASVRFRWVNILRGVARTREVTCMVIVWVVFLHAAAAEEFREVKVVGTQFRIVRSDGIILSPTELKGAVVSMNNARGDMLRFRIEDQMLDPKNPDGDITLYSISLWNPTRETWEPMCPPDNEGVAMGFPLSGVWTKSGKYVPTEDTFSLICTAGAIAKCVRMGYKPWKLDVSGTALGDYLQACTFMMRADYCGDGTSHTLNGTYINNYDKVGVVEREVSEKVREMTFEAAWGLNGAVCVRKARIPELASLDDLVRWCPQRLKGNIGVDCDKEEMLRSPYVLMLNES